MGIATDAPNIVGVGREILEHRLGGIMPVPTEQNGPVAMGLLLIDSLAQLFKQTEGMIRRAVVLSILLILSFLLF